MKKVDVDSLRAFRDKFDIPVKDADLEKLPFYKPEEKAAPRPSTLADSAAPRWRLHAGAPAERA